MAAQNWTIGTEPTPLTLETLKIALFTVPEPEPEPIGQWMAAQGFAPDRGGRLLLPESIRGEMEKHGPLFLPWYVRYHPLVPTPCLAWHTWPAP